LASSRTKSRTLPLAIDDGLALGCFAGAIVGEEAIENVARIDFGRQRGGFGFPRDVVGISAAITGIAIAGLLTAVAADFERGKTRGAANFLGGDLVGGDSDFDVGAVGFLGLATGEECRGRASVIPGAVTVGATFGVG
jgi:hypothetical protein